MNIIKRNILLNYLFLILLVISVSAQKAQVAKTSTPETNLRKHIEYLASDKFEGRRTGERGAAAASGYISSVFTQIKLMPGFRSAKGRPSYFQPFQYFTGVEKAKIGNEFWLELTNDSGQRMKVENLVPARPVGFSPNGEVANAKVIFAGFGIVSEQLKYDDYKDVDAKGKVVLIFDGNPDNDNPHSQFGRFDARTKALIAKDRGAIGVLLISRETNFDDDKLGQLKFDQTLGEAALPTFVVSKNTAANILGVGDGELKMIEGLTAAKANPAVKVNVGYRDTQPVVGFKVNLIKKTADAHNVIGILPGIDPVLKKEAVIIGAHYDHLGHGGQGSLAVNSSEIHRGADDNASGTSAILELARQFARERRNKRTIIFVAFSGEEEGLLGSSYYVNHPVFPLDKTVAMINLDMVGRLKDDKLTIGGIGTASEWNELVKRNNDILFDTNNGYGVGGKFALSLNEDGFGPSDHSSFYGKKIPVLFFFTGTHVDYHKPSDTADRINYEGEVKIISYVASIVKAIDKNPQPPTYTVAKSSGLGGRSGFNISLGTVPNYADTSEGLLLDGVRDNSPAAKAGLKGGDRIVKLAGKDVRNINDYTYILGEMKAGVEYEVIVVRGTESLTLKIIPVKR